MNYRIKRNIEKSLEDDDQIKETFHADKFVNFTLTKKGFVFYWKTKMWWDKELSFSIFSMVFELKSSDEYITQIKGIEIKGNEEFMALTNKQKIYTWTYDWNAMSQPKLKQILNHKGESQLITQICVGNNHNIVLTTKGELYSWGVNEKGQCGTGDRKPVCKPTKIKFPRLSKNDFIKQICISGDLNLILTNHGRVYVWGDNLCKRNEFILRPIEFPILLGPIEEKVVLLDTNDTQIVAFTNLNSCHLLFNKVLQSKSSYPLHKALSIKNTTLARQLMTPKNLNELDEDGESPLYIACYYGLEEMVKEILQKKDHINEMNDFNLVHITSAKGYLEIVKLLLDYGLKGSEKSIHASLCGGYTDITKLLINYQGELVNAIGKRNYTLLMLACVEGSVDLVKLLLSKGVKVNEQNDFGETALFSVVHKYSTLVGKDTLETNPDLSKDFLTIISMLLENQANVHIKNNEGLTATMIASQHCQYKLLNLIFQYNSQLIHTYSIEYGSLLHVLLCPRIEEDDFLFQVGDLS